MWFKQLHYPFIVYLASDVVIWFSAMDNGYGMFLNMLEYKLSDRGKYFIKVDKWYPSSQICSHCGRRKKLTLDQRVYKCECGLNMDRDLNAAINIKNEGMRILREAA